MIKIASEDGTGPWEPNEGPREWVQYVLRAREDGHSLDREERISNRRLMATTVQKQE